MGRFLRRRFGRKVFKIGVDAGFSCPHRGDDRTVGGCRFCSPHGSRSPLIGSTADIEEQIRCNAAYWRERYPDGGLMLYFQAYTSTLGSVESLREIYRHGLACEDFCAMIVGTRPDCVPNTIVSLLTSLRTAEREVWVELGLQSAHDSSLAYLNRGHGTEAYRDAAARLAEHGIPVIPHLIFGIPGEGQAERDYTLHWVLQNTPSLIGVKIHNLLLLPGTELYERYLSGEFAVYRMEEHLEAVANALEQLPPHIAAMRLTADLPFSSNSDERTHVPGGGADLPGQPWATSVFLGRLQQLMRQRGSRQGCRAAERRLV